MTALGQVFDRCPKAWLLFEAADEHDTIKDYVWFRRYGVLPVAGGKLDQPAKFIEAVTLIEAEVAAVEAAEKAIKAATAKTGA